MAIVLENKFFLSEIINRKVYLKTQRIGRLSDMVIIETGNFPRSATSSSVARSAIPPCCCHGINWL